MELGKKIPLYIVKITPMGLFLNEDPEELLNSAILPKEDVQEIFGDEIPELGGQVDVYCYRTKDSKLVVTTKAPLVENGEIGILKCVESNQYGAFLQWGYDKDVLLPFNEQFFPVKAGYKVTVGIYTDKTGRLCATQKLRKFLRTDSPFVEGDIVSGFIYDMKHDMGAFVAVNNKFFGLIMSNEVMPSMKIGSTISGRVTKVREDGKLNITVNKRIDFQMDEDSAKIYDILTKNDGFLPYHDKSNAETIRRVFDMSKKAFKRSIGKLYKEKRITIEEEGIRLIEEDIELIEE